MCQDQTYVIKIAQPFMQDTIGLVMVLYARLNIPSLARSAIWHIGGVPKFCHS